jgi:hypothetical protein
VDGLLCLLTDRIDAALLEALRSGRLAGLEGRPLPHCANRADLG